MDMEVLDLKAVKVIHIPSGVECRDTTPVARIEQQDEWEEHNHAGTECLVIQLFGELRLCLTVCDRVYTYYTTHEENSSHEVDTMVLSLGTALKNIFPAVPLTHIIRKVDIQPAKRMQQLDELERATLGGTRDMGPCGGFSTQYMCMCDYHALPYREEVAWDVDTIYLSHDTRELYLHDFDYLEQKDLIPIISALEYNTWFRKLRASHSKLSHEAIERILHVVSKSLSLEEIYLDNIGAKAEFANKLSLALLSNSNIPLQKLDLSHNPIEDKGLSNLCGLVAKLSPVAGGAVHISNPIGRQAKGLSHLNLSLCGLTGKGVNMLAHSLSVNKYMCQTLTFLSLAGNSLRDDVNNLYNFLAQPNTLKTLDLSATECAIDAVSYMCQTLTFLSLAGNSLRDDVNNLYNFLAQPNTLKTLDLSATECAIDAQQNVPSMQKLEQNLCFLEVFLHCQTLTFLSLAGNSLRDDVNNLYNFLAQPNTLKLLICQQQKCAIDAEIRTEFCLPTPNHSNYSVKFLPFPVHDAMLCMKTAPERTENLMRRIQDTLYRNVSPMKYSNGQAFRLQQGFLLSSTQQQVDRLVLQTGEAVRTLRRSGSDLVGANSLQWAEGLITDADSSKQLISHLHDVVLRRDEAGNPIETKLHQISSDLHTVITNYLQDTVESMVRSAQDKCPNVLSEEKVVDDVRAACLAKSQLSSQLVETAIVEQAGSVILNKVNEVNLAIASTVSDRVIDEVVDSLSKTCKNLQSGEGPRKRASTGTEMGSRERGSSESSTRSERSDTVSQGDDTTSQKSDPSPLATPQLASKRKSLHGRKLRPQSVVAESLDSVSELPSSCGQLQHLGKARPRRVKTRAPTRPMGRADLVEEDHDISEGVDTFFRPGSSTPTTPLISPDSENSPRLLKYGSTSSVESSPHTGGARTGSERGSIESLTRSDSLARSESDVTRESPRPRTKSRDTEEEDEMEDEDQSIDEKSRSVTSLIGRRANEPMLKRSPDMSARKASTSSNISSMDDKSRSEEDGKEDSPPRKVAGLPKFGMGIGGNILAEMKMMQEKRTSVLPKDEDKDRDERKENPSSSLLAGVRLRSTGLADSLKSPTNGFPRGSSGSKSPNCNRDSVIENAGEYESSDATEDEQTSAPVRSVREMAASLARSSVGEEAGGKKKSSSLPRNTPQAANSGVAPELLVILDKRRSTITNNQLEELEETWVDGEQSTGSSAAPPLHRQTSHKHVLTTDLALEDVVNV
ncbi:F-actin-uncapping protein LRRC16A-like [Penaeus chinensis]|uniref:F-actin-uncapping protein LRRC16A-like n=1 Tax=Penaeus chinensis TaxID=139456 RepID=UPI001FB5D87A|nr:F-actin-uncapping protein LRRC16A-like [Penaeus chinensis]